LHGQTQLGGAITASGAPTTVLARSAVFSNNTADEGGVLYADDGARLAFKDVQLLRNVGRDVGGSFYVSGHVEMDMHNATFVGNRAPLSPGVHVFSSTVRISGSFFADNNATNTGVFGTQNADATLHVTSSTFWRNHATWAGGVLYMQAGASTGISHSGFANFVDCRFVNNTCSSMGGVVYAEDGVLTMARCDVRGSIARETGGVIIARNADVALVDSVFDSNIAVTSGGVVSEFSYKGSFLNVTNCTMSGNSVGMGNGGALSLTGGRTWIYESKFFRNYALQGGAIAFQSSCIHGNGGLWPSSRGTSSSSGTTSSGGTGPVTGTSTSAGRRLSGVASGKPPTRPGTKHNVGIEQCGEQLLWMDTASSVVNNSAQLSGGGVQVQAWQDSTINLASLSATARNNIAQVGGDVAVAPYEIALHGAPASNLSFASREGRSQGLLPIAVGVYGPHRTPVSGVRVVVRPVGSGAASGAVLLGAEGLSDASGVADLPLLKLRAKAGTVGLRVELPDYPSVDALKFEVVVRKCEPGEVASDGGDTCTPCGLTTYSFSPGNLTCDECPAHATCPGGSVLTPNPGYW